MLADLTKAGSESVLGWSGRSVSFHWGRKVEGVIIEQLVLVAIEAQYATSACTPRSTATLEDRHALTRPAAKGVRALTAAIAERCRGDAAKRISVVTPLLHGTSGWWRESSERVRVLLARCVRRRHFLVCILFRISVDLGNETCRVESAHPELVLTRRSHSSSHIIWAGWPCCVQRQRA